MLVTTPLCSINEALYIQSGCCTSLGHPKCFITIYNIKLGYKLRISHKYTKGWPKYQNAILRFQWNNHLWKICQWYSLHFTSRQLNIITWQHVYPAVATIVFQHIWIYNNVNSPFNTMPCLNSRLQYSSQAVWSWEDNPFIAHRPDNSIAMPRVQGDFPVSANSSRCSAINGDCISLMLVISCRNWMKTTLRLNYSYEWM